MAFTLFYLLEACLLIANAIAILNDRFLKKSKYNLKILSSSGNVVGFHVDQMNMNVPQ